MDENCKATHSGGAAYILCHTGFFGLPHYNFRPLKAKRDIALFLALIVLLISYKIVEYNFGNVPFLHAYLEDIIALPLLLKSSLLVVQYSNKTWESLVLDNEEIVAITVVFAVYFEAILPHYNANFTADPLDVLCYSLGAWFYGVFVNKTLVVN